MAPAPAPAPVRHPAYLHALSDLRDARAMLERPVGGANRGEVKWDENSAIRELDAAINEIKRASIDDGKNVADHQPIDANLAYEGRLQKAMELVDRARADVNQEEDNGFANGLRTRAMGHIDGAARFIHDGMEAHHIAYAPPPPIVPAAPPPPPAPPPMIESAHPAYLHALSDLRDARAMLERPARPEVKWDEQRAIREIDAAIHEIKEASIDDGKDVSVHIAIDTHLGHRDRMRKALELLRGAEKDIEQREDNGFAKGLKRRANEHIHRAAEAVREAVEARNAGM
jgi:tetratricopeptide (TPR) repeat protein